MKGQDALFSRASDEWETPPDIFNDLNAEFNFTLDPACRSDNAKCAMKCAIDKGVDGLTTSWSQFSKSAFVNPPHSRITKWIEKSIIESAGGCQVVMLIPCATGNGWWHDLVLPNAYEIREVRGRIHFKGRIKKPGQKGVPKEKAVYIIGIAPGTFDSAIVIFNGRQENGKPRRTEYIQPKHRSKKNEQY
jgi:phage N-6-adenine-methyltransferase